MLASRAEVSPTGIVPLGPQVPSERLQWQLGCSSQAMPSGLPLALTQLAKCGSFTVVLRVKPCLHKAQMKGAMDPFLKIGLFSDIIEERVCRRLCNPALDFRADSIPS